MAKLEFVEATREHAIFIAANMRGHDLLELEASGRDPFDAMLKGWKTSTKCWTGLVDGVPAIMFGVAPISALTGHGSPWLLGTPDALKIKRNFLLNSVGYVKEMLRLYPQLTNYVDCRNRQSVRWLKWLGFQLLDPVPIGVNGEMFHPFIMRKEDHV